MWRYGDQEANAKVYYTTTVNFGDKPAGCIAIAAIRETTERYGGNSDAAFFLKNRTYVVGAGTIPELENISKELEEIAAKGGFTVNSKKPTCQGIPLKMISPSKFWG